VSEEGLTVGDELMWSSSVATGTEVKSAAKSDAAGVTGSVAWKAGVRVSKKGAVATAPADAAAAEGFCKGGEPEAPAVASL
jgi:hypothetical protein